MKTNQNNSTSTSNKKSRKTVLLATLLPIASAGITAGICIPVAQSCAKTDPVTPTPTPETKATVTVTGGATYNADASSAFVGRDSTIVLTPTGEQKIESITSLKVGDTSVTNFKFTYDNQTLSIKAQYMTNAKIDIEVKLEQPGKVMETLECSVNKKPTEIGEKLKAEDIVVKGKYTDGTTTGALGWNASNGYKIYYVVGATSTELENFDTVGYEFTMPGNHKFVVRYAKDLDIETSFNITIEEKFEATTKADFDTIFETYSKQCAIDVKKNIKYAPNDIKKVSVINADGTETEKNFSAFYETGEFAGLHLETSVRDVLIMISDGTDDLYYLYDYVFKPGIAAVYAAHPENCKFSKSTTSLNFEYTGPELTGTTTVYKMRINKYGYYTKGFAAAKIEEYSQTLGWNVEFSNTPHEIKPTEIDDVTDLIWKLNETTSKYQFSLGSDAHGSEETSVKLEKGKSYKTVIHKIDDQLVGNAPTKVSKFTLPVNLFDQSNLFIERVIYGKDQDTASVQPKSTYKYDENNLCWNIGLENGQPKGYDSGYLEIDFHVMEDVTTDLRLSEYTELSPGTTINITMDDETAQYSGNILTPDNVLVTIPHDESITEKVKYGEDGYKIFYAIMTDEEAGYGDDIEIEKFNNGFKIPQYFNKETGEPLQYKIKFKVQYKDLTSEYVEKIIESNQKTKFDKTLRANQYLIKELINDGYITEQTVKDNIEKIYVNNKAIDLANVTISITDWTSTFGTFKVIKIKDNGTDLIEITPAGYIYQETSPYKKLDSYYTINNDGTMYDDTLTPYINHFVPTGIASNVSVSFLNYFQDGTKTIRIKYK